MPTDPTPGHRDPAETEREEIAAAIGGCADVYEAIGVAVGMASMCWENPRGAGVFNSDHASTIVAALHEHIQMNWSISADLSAARQRLAASQTEVEQLRALLVDMVDPGPCSFDHHGGCQAHGYLDLEDDELCPHEAARRLLGADRVH